MDGSQRTLFLTAFGTPSLNNMQQGTCLGWQDKDALGEEEIVSVVPARLSSCYFSGAEISALLLVQAFSHDLSTNSHMALVIICARCGSQTVYCFGAPVCLIVYLVPEILGCIPGLGSLSSASVP